jgi:TnpA family transposase
VLPSTLLHKLNHYSRKNRLFKAFQELGRVIRTLYLLRYISDMPMRRQVTDATNKAESFHRFSSWLRFGAQGVITHNAPEEHEKRVKYTDLLANALMLYLTTENRFSRNCCESEG